MTCKGCELIKECRETGAELQTCRRYKPETNFDRITDSPEALAEFIEDVTYRCYGCKVIFADNCPHRKRGAVMFCEREDCMEWLKQPYSPK